jgi:hypothetical protein
MANYDYSFYAVQILAALIASGQTNPGEYDAAAQEAVKYAEALLRVLNAK